MQHMDRSGLAGAVLVFMLVELFCGYSCAASFNVELIFCRSDVKY